MSKTWFRDHIQYQGRWFWCFTNGFDSCLLIQWVNRFIVVSNHWVQITFFYDYKQFKSSLVLNENMGSDWKKVHKNNVIKAIDGEYKQDTYKHAGLYAIKLRKIDRFINDVKSFRSRRKMKDGKFWDESVCSYNSEHGLIYK